MKRSALTFVAAASLLGASHAQTTLSDAQKTFRAADKSGDGVLTSSEATAASVPPGAFRSSDKDGDGHLTQDEFIVFYRDLLSKANQPISPELNREADRVNAAIRQAAGRGRSGAQGNTGNTGQGGAQSGQTGQATGGAGSGVGDARSAGATGGQTGQAPNARAEAARRQLTQEQRAAAQEAAGASPLEQRAVSAIDDLERRMADGSVSPEDFRRLRSSLIGDARRAAGARGDNGGEASLTPTQQRLVAALQTLEQQAQDGQTASLTQLRELAIRNARELVASRQAPGAGAPGAGATGAGATGAGATGAGATGAAGETRSPDARAAAARAELTRREREAAQNGAQDVVGSTIGADLASAIDQLERRALAGQATPEDYRAVRERLIGRARRAARAGEAGGAGAGVEDAQEAAGTQRLLQALDQMEAKAQGGRLSAEDFASLRELAIANARRAQREPQAQPGASSTTEASADSSAAGAATPTGAAPRYSRRLMAALDTLERRALSGGATAEDFQALRDQFIAAARRADRNADGSAADAPNMARLQAALDDLQAKALRGEVKRADFEALRAEMAADARRAANGRTEGSTEASGAAGATGGTTPSGATPVGSGGNARAGGANDPARGASGQPQPQPQRGGANAGATRRGGDPQQGGAKSDQRGAGTGGAAGSGASRQGRRGGRGAQSGTPPGDTSGGESSPGDASGSPGTGQSGGNARRRGGGGI